jgi:hypothetical protein
MHDALFEHMDTTLHDLVSVADKRGSAGATLRRAASRGYTYGNRLLNRALAS